MNYELNFYCEEGFFCLLTLAFTLAIRVKLSIYWFTIVNQPIVQYIKA